MSIDYEFQIEPLLLASRGEHLRGYIPIVCLSRLASSLYDTSGRAEYALKFDIDSSGQANITGSVNTELSMYCHRCMHKVLKKVESKLVLGIVSCFAESELLLERYEPLVVEESLLKFADIIEDEILLALPLIVTHADQDCTINEAYSLSDENYENRHNLGTSEAGLKKNPFSILEKLKSD